MNRIWDMVIKKANNKEGSNSTDKIMIIISNNTKKLPINHLNFRNITPKVEETILIDSIATKTKI